MQFLVDFRFKSDKYDRIIITCNMYEVDFPPVRISSYHARSQIDIDIPRQHLGS